MTRDHDPDDWLRTALARSLDAHPSSPAPVDRILTAGRARRKRRRAGAATVAAAACVLAISLAVPLLGPHRTVSPAPQASLTAGPTPTPGTVTTKVGDAVLHGQRWSVALEFHRTLPKGFTPPTLPDGTTVPGTSLLCQRMTINGVRIDHQGGPWADCQPVTGTHDPHPAGELGLWGLHDKGTTGTRLMVANPEPNVAYAIVTLTDGTHLKATTATVPGTTYKAWAVAIPNGKTIATVDQYNTHHHRLSHDTDWR
ncbi:hypothetical protein [Peterkaempfera sp. SMS 1(5)a]|uniref:hypothetical protein n=1 Tax=Peterkaempfera podocarpi TaxID=3232308 RepID=UPI00366C6FC3